MDHHHHVSASRPSSLPSSALKSATRPFLEVALAAGAEWGWFAAAPVGYLSIVDHLAVALEALRAEIAGWNSAPRCRRPPPVRSRTMPWTYGWTTFILSRWWRWLCRAAARGAWPRLHRPGLGGEHISNWRRPRPPFTSLTACQRRPRLRALTCIAVVVSAQAQHLTPPGRAQPADRAISRWARRRRRSTKAVSCPLYHLGLGRAPRPGSAPRRGSSACRPAAGCDWAKAELWNEPVRKPTRRTRSERTQAGLAWLSQTPS